MKILIDTSVWIRTRTDPVVKDLISGVAKSHDIASCEMVDREVMNACDFLRSKQMESADQLQSFYQSFPKAYIPFSPAVKGLVEEYSALASQFGLRQEQIKDMEGDFTIMAFSSAGDVSLVFTFNRKSLGSDLARLIYLMANEKRGLRVPVVIMEEGTFKKLLG